MSLLFDVNIFVVALSRFSPDHRAMQEYLSETLAGSRPVAVHEQVLSSCARIVTARRFPGGPSDLQTAFAFAETILTAPATYLIAPGPRHWAIFHELATATNATGNLVPDAYIAARAIEHDLELVSTDRDFARFPNLRYTNRQSLKRPATPFA